MRTRAVTFRIKWHSVVNIISSPTEFLSGPVDPKITAAVECRGNRITVRIEGNQAISLTDNALADGQVGMAFFGHGRTIFHDLQVEELK